MAKGSRGVCQCCWAEFSRSGMQRHLDSCSHRVVAPGGENCFTLSIEGAHDKRYWMYVEMSGKALLQELDSFLRDIWLECCWHLSQFRIAGERYESESSDGVYEDNSMDVCLQDVLPTGVWFFHEYDFGSTTVLRLKLVSVRKGASPENGVRLLARNIAPDIRCRYCGESAELVPGSFILQDEACVCTSCAEQHEEEPELLLPLLNSPRTGVCGYGG